MVLAEDRLLTLIQMTMCIQNIQGPKRTVNAVRHIYITLRILVL